MARATGRSQGDILRECVEMMYLVLLDHPEYGPLLKIAVRAMEAEEEGAGPHHRRRKGMTVKLSDEEAKELRRFAYNATGDPDAANEIARQAIKDRIGQ